MPDICYECGRQDDHEPGCLEPDLEQLVRDHGWDRVERCLYRDPLWDLRDVTP